MNSEKDLEQESREKIREIEKMVSDLPMTPDISTYVGLCQVLQELHFLERYDLVIRICNAWLCG